MTKTHMLFFLICAVLSGCTPAGRTASTYNHVEQKSAIAGSIFSSDLERASNDDGASVLDGVIPLKENGDLAMLSIGNMYFLDAGFSDAVNKTITETLQDNPYIGKVEKAPRILLENKLCVRKSAQV